MIDVRVQAADFDPGRQVARLEELKKAAVVSFIAIAAAGDDVAEILIDHYPPLAKSELARIAKEAEERWGLAGIVLVHRHGRLRPGDRLLFAGIAASDPDAAQAALAFLVGRLRTEAPFWRKHVSGDGSAKWIEPR